MLYYDVQYNLKNSNSIFRPSWVTWNVNSSHLPGREIVFALSGQLFDACSTIINCVRRHKGESPRRVPNPLLQHQTWETPSPKWWRGAGAFESVVSWPSCRPRVQLSPTSSATSRYCPLFCNYVYNITENDNNPTRLNITVYILSSNLFDLFIIRFIGSIMFC